MTDDTIVTNQPDVSNYTHIRTSYQNNGVAGKYDAQRFQTTRGKFLNQRFVTAVAGALNLAQSSGHKVDSVLDIPCGTGRLFPKILEKGYKLVGSDISRHMMSVARPKAGPDGNVPMVQCDATRMPYKTGSFDAITCVRFLTMRVPKEIRSPIFKEMSRVTKAWVVMECRDKHSWGFIMHWVRAKIFRRSPLVNYFVKDEIAKELSSSGLELIRIFRPFGMFSNKWLLLCRTMRSV
ncbi:MAG: class I SAM-dependent methyltransferase [Candidatus Brocadiia bacterium]